ncbi:MAG TPA: glutamate synthase [Rhodospirillaceae bacterium]|jgi:CDGSH-type Zn-finger protein|nr:glutamate synthase [Rhodospirillaceae bacterium]MAX62878.1 glutamate synthase [Rhodospirillaceae bacterium]MBB57725.1 glutamate synthase [Rhodospirillaceae bacterium]HAJ21423.1 glutamate synthase [Rhodospirillaceae bacterium]HBM14323.1 glutamate synthase [Rhodospirillaceae bacterium]
MTDPLIAAKQPFPIDVVAGQKYFWCACGRSASQPFCDGSHTGTKMTPQIYTADKSRTVFFCGCKHSVRGPLCDGTHSKF